MTRGRPLQIPHNAMCPAVDSVQPVLKDVDAEALKEDGGEAEEQTVTWSPVDRLKMSVGLLYAVCIIATDSDVSCGFCAPRPRLLERWQVPPPGPPYRCPTVHGCASADASATVFYLLAASGAPSPVGRRFRLPPLPVRGARLITVQ